MRTVSAIILGQQMDGRARVRVEEHARQDPNRALRLFVVSSAVVQKYTSSDVVYEKCPVTRNVRPSPATWITESGTSIREMFPSPISIFFFSSILWAPVSSACFAFLRVSDASESG